MSLLRFAATVWAAPENVSTESQTPLNYTGLCTNKGDYYCGGHKNLPKNPKMGINAPNLPVSAYRNNMQPAG